MTDFEIRRYEPPDQDRVWLVHEVAFDAAPIEFIEDPTCTEKLWAIEEAYLDGSGEFLVGGTSEIVAIGGFSQTDAMTVEISRMRVHPEYQRHGYGRALLAALEERARERGFGMAQLGTHVALTAARQFYEANGYHETRREPHSVAGDTFVYYRKDLDLTR